ncbi:MAG: HD domain-containing protein [Bacteroides sp.]|nr:HD domain-containing protein [Bacteroides sp.]
MNSISHDIRQYIENSIIPRYAAFDKAHRADHVNMVINRSLELAEQMPRLDKSMLYVAAAFHDLGLVNGRERHHIDSRIILESDPFVKAHFTTDQIRLMGEAVEDHRASKSGRPRNDYGLIVAEADRLIDPETIIRRTIQYGLRNYPHLDREGHYDRTVSHVTAKYGPNGYLKILISWSDNAARLDELRRILADKVAFRHTFDRIFDHETLTDNPHA